jgi:uncharacterized protein (TIGR02646 family)
MRKFRKIKSPEYLKSNWKIWGIEWKLQYRDPNRNNTFNWRGHWEDLILNYLGLSTQFHCSFCDIDNITVGAAATIEHFKPKHKFFSVAYHYNNLYSCCGECQKKGKRYSTLLIKPDLPIYSFEEYFEIDISNGEINPNPAKTLLNRQMAEKTIELYKLNNGDKPRLRLKSLNLYISSNPTMHIDNYSYRFFIEEFIRITT